MPDDLGTLGFAHLLHDDLLGGLRRDTSESHRFDLLFDDIAHCQRRLALFRLGERNLTIFAEVLFVLDHDPATESIVLAGAAINLDANTDVLTFETLARRAGQRRFDSLENDVSGHALLVGDGVNDQQYLFAHAYASPKNRFLISNN